MQHFIGREKEQKIPWDFNIDEEEYDEWVEEV